ncbi:uncharacterized protein MAM_02800 [Metarhizium album ARSEF 1941]|uniref:Uncharacterized protein n=1 Tax=Metarhizium album (strain ARSEF 1941) TaxID=1081103 RepID=A0A0B2X091_METAS|nr:uncharacterized protein MAM_02800 [Metarhizium album ARSEF 1941]KHN99102.1 hypothetical protein MAM_02800 [Metarhizium album ARSEF 1941]
MASPRDAARLRQGLNPLATNSLPPSTYGNHVNSPMSAASMASPFLQSAQTPASAIQPYNPQEWVPSPAPMPDVRSRHLPVDGGQASAAPPPPYSPPRSRPQRPMSTALEHVFARGSTPPPPSRLTISPPHRPSPEPPVNPSFPPPPGAGGRGSSRDRRFGLPSLGRRNDHEQSQASSPDLQTAAMHVRRGMGPSMSQPEPGRIVAPIPSTLPLGVPPAARRAASTGAIDSPTSQRSRSTSQTRWEPGMPLPPPPPGPPPSSSRSQSVQSIGRASVPVISPPTRRPPPSGVTTLGPVPPTPADWVDTDAEQGRPRQPFRGRSPGLVVDTAFAANATNVPEPPGSSSSMGSLNRAMAVRHDKTILQRRAESRSRHTSHRSIDAVAQPHNISDIVVPCSSGGTVPRFMAGRSTPRSAGRRDIELLRTGDSLTLQDHSRNSTPRAPASGQPEAATPPFSPYHGKGFQMPAVSPALAPKALPTPPPRTRSASGSRPRVSSRPPISALTPISKHTVIGQTAEQFAAATIERFRSFASSESAAASDADRVRLFADFIVNESRVRRERYSSAIGEMGSEIFDLTRDLFRPMVSSSRRESGGSRDESTPASTDPSHSQRGSASSVIRGDGLSSSAPASASLSASPGSAPPQGNWTNNYMPSLSPILSMSVSDNHENGSSRGRPPSRWWETDSQGEPRTFERSKRESKYMGVPKDQLVEEEQGTGAYTGSSEYESSMNYPPEKTGWHRQEEPSPWTPQSLRLSSVIPAGSSSSQSSHNTPDAVDVSRLVTLPPPYPRHYPALNNNHPELTATRTAVRALNELTEIDKVKERFESASSKRREEFSKAASERRHSLMANLQKEISSGNIGYADAAAIESDSQQQEKNKKKELEKTEYEQFQNEVIRPINDLLTAQISKADALYQNLSEHLFDNGRTDADMPQEEGDDRPELLEKLTLLKWIFETRESLHRAIYDILSDRNTRYREVVLTPYRLSGNSEKLRSAEAFFAEDATKREYSLAVEVLDRARQFRTTVEEAVERGVALQLSAFWDIAPPLGELLDSIPEDLDGFNIQIPASEFEENPAYHDHPLQYLYSLLTHAEKSTRQFIESHTNLLCLLHEVKGAAVKAKARVLETQVTEADGSAISAEDRQQRANSMRQSEDRRLTEDLQEKVRLVEEQWNSALGEGIRTVKDRAGVLLLSTGGWDETLEEEQSFLGLMGQTTDETHT